MNDGQRDFPTFGEDEALGTVEVVDTATVYLRVLDSERLQRLKVNRLLAIQLDTPGQLLIGTVERIRRSGPSGEEFATTEPDDLPEPSGDNVVRVALIGTFKRREGERRNVFERSLERVASIGAFAFPLERERLTAFMQSIGEHESGRRLSLGRYTIDTEAAAYLDADKFFQRHAVIVGSTGSGKSFATAHMLEQIAALVAGNAVVFDVHDEYGPLAKEDGVSWYRIASVADAGTPASLDSGIVHLPYWLLRFEALLALLVERSDSSAVNQAAVVRDAVLAGKVAYLEERGAQEMAADITVDSPVPFSLDDVVAELIAKDTEREAGARPGADRAGPYNGKLTRMIARIKSKIDDRRLAFMFKPPNDTFEIGWLARLATHLVGNATVEGGVHRRNVRILKLDDVPSEMLALTVSLVADLAFQVHQWSDRTARPLALFCDEAHLYVPVADGQDIGDAVSLTVFERIAKEGRKYGVSLVLISQRPSEINRTVLSQCNNYVALRLLNIDDQNTIRRLLPDNLGGYGDILPSLDIGEAVVVGDASLLPSRVRLDLPKRRPDSQTKRFWEAWSAEAGDFVADNVVENWRRQRSAP